MWLGNIGVDVRRDEGRERLGLERPIERVCDLTQDEGGVFNLNQRDW